MNFLINLHNQPAITHAIDPYTQTHHSLVTKGWQEAFLDALDKIRYAAEKGHGLTWDIIHSYLDYVIEHNEFEIVSKPDFAFSWLDKELRLSFFGSGVDGIDTAAQITQALFDKTPEDTALIPKRWEPDEYIKEVTSAAKKGGRNAVLAKIQAALENPENEHEIEIAMKTARNVDWWNDPKVSDLVFKVWTTHPRDEWDASTPADSLLEIAPMQSLPKFRSELLKQLASNDAMKSKAAKRLLADISWDANENLRRAAMNLIRSQDETFLFALQMKRKLFLDPEYQSIIKSQLSSETPGIAEKAMDFLVAKHDSTGMTLEPFDAEIAALLKKSGNINRDSLTSEQESICNRIFTLSVDQLPKTRQAIAEAMASPQIEWAEFVVQRTYRFNISQYPELRSAFFKFLSQATRAQKISALDCVSQFPDWHKIPQLKSLVLELLQPPYDQYQWMHMSSVAHRTHEWKTDPEIIKAMKAAKDIPEADDGHHASVMDAVQAGCLSSVRDMIEGSSVSGGGADWN